MPEINKPSGIVRFGPFELSIDTGELRNNGIRLNLSGQPIKVLTLLVTRPGELVTREELQERLWPGNPPAGDFEKGLNAAVNRLRDNLRDSATEPKYIETVPGRGYRFIGKLEDLNGEVGPGKTVSHYRILEVIGRGGMGVVYKGQDLRLGRHVALKFLPKELATNNDALGRFRREASTASSLNHPNICTIYEIDEHAKQPFIVMELLEGQTLRESLDSGALQRNQLEPMLDIGQVLDIALQLLDGLQAAHQRGILHRDIKPANIFVTNALLVKILDFGLAKLIGSARKSELETKSTLSGPTVDRHPLFSGLGAAIGTAGYMAPEQVRGEDLDLRADLFSVGVVIYEMATGSPAFDGRDAAARCYAILTEVPVPIHELRPSVPPMLDQILTKATDKKRELRYQSATELRTDLAQVKDSLINRIIPAVTSTRKEPQTCVLVAVVPRTSVIESAIEVAVWVRHAEAQDACDSTLAKMPLSTPVFSFYERTFDLQTNLGAAGNLQPTDIVLRLDAPNFEPSAQIKKLDVPPTADSSGCTFLIKPCVAGELVANLELLNMDEKVVASRLIRTRAVFRENADWTVGFTSTFPLLKASYEGLRRRSNNHPIDLVPSFEQETRILEAAAPKDATIGCSVEVIAMVRESFSTGGLRALLRAEGASSLTQENVRERSFLVEFPLDDHARPQSRDITLRLESPGFDPSNQVRKLQVPPKGDSPTCTFLVVPRVIGEHVMNLELLDLHEQVLASRSIRIHALSNNVEITQGQTVVSIPLIVVIGRGATAAAEAFTSRTAAEPIPAETLEDSNNVDSPQPTRNTSSGMNRGAKDELRAAAVSAENQKTRNPYWTLILTGVMVVVMVGAWFISLFHRRVDRSTAIAAPSLEYSTTGDIVVFSEVANLTGDTAFNGLTLSKSLPQYLVGGTSPSLKVVSLEQIPSILIHMKPDASADDTASALRDYNAYRSHLDQSPKLARTLASEVCLGVQGTTVIAGSVSEDETHYKIAVTATNCHTDQILGTAEGEAQKLEGTSAEQRRGNVSKALTDAAGRLLQKLLGPGNPQAPAVPRH